MKATSKTRRFKYLIINIYNDKETPYIYLLYNTSGELTEFQKLCHEKMGSKLTETLHYDDWNQLIAHTRVNQGNKIGQYLTAVINKAWPSPKSVKVDQNGNIV